MTRRSDAILATIASRLGAAQPGERAQRAYGIARWARSLVLAGAVDDSDARSACVSAALATGLQPREVDGHIDRAWRDQTTPAEDTRRVLTLRRHHPATSTPPPPSTQHSATHAPKTYPPLRQLRALWMQAIHVTADDQASAWLRSRSIDPEAVELLDVARVLAPGQRLPRWARGWYRHHRLLVRAVDHTGATRSVQARLIDQDAPSDARKTLWPSGYTMRGIVFVNSPARYMLGWRTVTSIDDDTTPPWGDALPRVLIVEGLPDFLAAAVHYDTKDSVVDPSPRVVIGIAAGSWTDKIAAKVPTGSIVRVATDPDIAGRKYAVTIARTLDDRCDVGQIDLRPRTDT